ncbi:MAG: hypothetical protein AB3N16_11135 [Flavobacteriaceae bacterium]
MGAFSKLYGNSFVLMKLEQNKNELIQLKKHLNSYGFPSTDHLLSNKFLNVSHRLEKLIAEHGEVLHTVEERKSSRRERKEAIKRQFSDFAEVRQRVWNYIDGARSTHRFLKLKEDMP